MEIKMVADADGIPRETYVFADDEYAVVTGAISGIKTLPDGTAIDVTPPYVATASQEQAAELQHIIALHHVENGNPNDVDVLTDPDTGARVPVQRPFVYEHPETGEVLVGVGVPHGEHPLDETNGITPDAADPRITSSSTSSKKKES